MTKTILSPDVVSSVWQVVNVQHHTVKMGPGEVLAALRWRSVSPRTFDTEVLDTDVPRRALFPPGLVAWPEPSLRARSTW